VCGRVGDVSNGEEKVFKILEDFLLDNHFSVIYTTVRHEQFRSVNIKENENE